MTIVITIVLLIVAYQIFKPKDPRTRIQTQPSQNRFEQSDMQQKYSILIGKILESPIAKITSVTRNEVVISSTMPNTYTEFKIRESSSEVFIDWYANLAHMGIKTQSFRYNIGTSQTHMYDQLQNHMLSLANTYR